MDTTRHSVCHKLQSTALTNFIKLPVEIKVYFCCCEDTFDLPEQYFQFFFYNKKEAGRKHTNPFGPHKAVNTHTCLSVKHADETSSSFLHFVSSSVKSVANFYQVIVLSFKPPRGFRFNQHLELGWTWNSRECPDFCRANSLAGPPDGGDVEHCCHTAVSAAGEYHLSGFLIRSVDVELSSQTCHFFKTGINGLQFGRKTIC